MVTQETLQAELVKAQESMTQLIANINKIAGAIQTYEYLLSQCNEEQDEDSTEEETG